MSKWNAWTLTKAGQALYAKADAGKTKIILSKMALGDGTPTDLENCTELAHKVIEMDITKLEIENSTMCTVQAAINTAALAEALTVSEWGIYADDPDEGTILLGIATDSEPDIIEAGGVVAYEQTMGMTLVTSSAASVEVKINSNAFVTKSSLDNAVDEIKSQNTAEIDAAKQELTQFVDKTANDMQNKLENDIYQQFYSQYAQVTKLNTVSLKGLTIPIKETQDFRRPPLEVLKLRDDGNSCTTTLCDFDNSDAGDFIENQYIEFAGGTMHPKTVYNIGMSTPQAIGAGYIADSALIDLSLYSAIKDVSII